MIAVGFSAGGMNVMQVVADQFGTTNTPDKVYPSYVCDAVDHESADLNVAIPIYGLFVTGLNFTKNPNLPPVFGVVGQKDGLSAMMLPSLPECADIFKDFSFYLAPDAPTVWVWALAPRAMWTTTPRSPSGRIWLSTSSRAVWG